jgi:hypothetical protein
VSVDPLIDKISFPDESTTTPQLNTPPEDNPCSLVIVYRVEPPTLFLLQMLVEFTHISK